jgi:hypothetical protein
MSIVYVVCQMNSYHFVPRGLVVIYSSMFCCGLVMYVCMFVSLWTHVYNMDYCILLVLWLHM